MLAMNKIIYLDNASKTIPYLEVVEKFNEISTTYFANPSSIHALGNRANRELELTKEEILKLFKLNNHRVVFTASATEANNLAIKGVALKYRHRGKHLITSAYEHPSVLEAFRQLEEEFGFEVDCLLPNKDGVITSEMVKKLIRNDTILVSVMAVNNEIGAINPIEDIANLLKDYPKIYFHVDAAQEIGKNINPISYQNVDLVTVSAHKTHGLIGVGALLIKKNLELLPLLSGGGQEYGLRSGTSALALAVSFSKALEISIRDYKKHYEIVMKNSNLLLEYLKSHPDLYELNLPTNINPYIINFSTLTKKGSVVVEALSNLGVMVSSISACHSKKEKGSHVVKALGKGDKIANNTIRVSLSYLNTEEDIKILISDLEQIIGAIR